MSPAARTASRMYWAFTLVLLAGALVRVWETPVEETMGPIQKIFYLHLPVALSMFAAAFVVFVGSVGYLWTRRAEWDLLADAAARITVLTGSVVLLTGMIWARQAWGHWWTWSPRLTFSLALWLLYAVYLVVRPTIESPARRAVISAVYGIVAFLDVPLVYLSTKLLVDIHPSSVQLAPPMRTTLLVCFFPIVLTCGGLVWARYRLSRRLATPAATPSDAPPGLRVAGGHA